MLVAVVGFFLAVNAAVVFRSTQSLCNGTEQIILRSNGTFELYDDGVSVYAGKYSIDRSTGSNVIELYVEDNTLRCTFNYKSDRMNISSLTFRGNVYRPCGR